MSLRDQLLNMNLSFSVHYLFEYFKARTISRVLITNSHYIIDTLHYSKAHRHGSILPGIFKFHYYSIKSFYLILSYRKYRKFKILAKKENK